MQKKTHAVQQLFLMLLGLACAISSSAAPTSDTELAIRLHVDRTAFVVFDPRIQPPSAARIAVRDRADADASAFASILGPIASVTVWFPQAIVSTEVLEEERKRDPLSPLSTLNEILLVKFLEGVDVQRELQRLRADNRVIAAEPNSLVKFATPDYSIIGATTPPTNIDGKFQWGLQLLRVPAAHDKVRGNATISMIDTGVYWSGTNTISELATALRPQFSASLRTAGSGQVYSDPDFDEAASFPDFQGHGTHVAGAMVASRGDNGVTGVCPGCNLQVLGGSTDGGTVGSAILRAVAAGTQVINLSLAVQIGGTSYSPDNRCALSPTTPPCNAILIAKLREVVVVAASGNDRYRVQFPANQDGVLAVGGLQLSTHSPVAGEFWTTSFLSSTTADCMITSSPLFGEGSNCGATQFLVGPARNVLSTFYPNEIWNADQRCGSTFDGQNLTDPQHTAYIESNYGTCTGTSMASPYVASAAALTRSANPLLVASDIKRILQRHASGNDTRLDDRLGYGFPFVDNAVIASLSGASLLNPTAFDVNVKNRLTPLFSLYSATARNHFYTIAPQMAVAAINGTLTPSPSYRLNQASAIAQCPTTPCQNNPVQVSPPFSVLKADNSAAAGASVLILLDELFGNSTVNPSSSVQTSLSNGVVPTGMVWTSYLGGDYGNRQARLFASVEGSMPLQYSRVGNTIAGYPYFPSLTLVGSNPRSTVSVYVSHVNPLGSGPELVPLHRLSAKCGSVASPTCDNSQSPVYNPFHVTHRYTTLDSEKTALLASGYMTDGIEGYVFPTSYANAPVSGAVRLCRRVDPLSDEMILFPGTGSNGQSCNPPFPSYAASSYYSDAIGGNDWLGWAMPNFGGNTPPTVSLTSPANGATVALGSSVTLTANASDANGVANVKFYANGVLVASDNSSPYNKSWTPTSPGSYRIYAVATDSHPTTPWQASSNPRQITVGSCPSTVVNISNGGFETPSLPFGTYDDAPAGATWTFVAAGPAGQSGVSANGSAFTDRNPSAPAGTQVGYIQGANWISQSVNFASSGVHCVRLQAAQRDPYYNQSTLGLELYVDNVKVGSTELTPPDRNYSTRTSIPFVVSSGLRNIRLQGVNNGFDNSLFIDSVQLLAP